MSRLICSCTVNGSPQYFGSSQKHLDSLKSRVQLTTFWARTGIILTQCYKNNCNLKNVCLLQQCLAFTERNWENILRAFTSSGKWQCIAGLLTDHHIPMTNPQQTCYGHLTSHMPYLTDICWKNTRQERSCPSPSKLKNSHFLYIPGTLLSTFTSE